MTQTSHEHHAKVTENRTSHEHRTNITRTLPSPHTDSTYSQHAQARLVTRVQELEDQLQVCLLLAGYWLSGFVCCSSCILLTPLHSNLLL